MNLPEGLTFEVKKNRRPWKTWDRLPTEVRLILLEEVVFDSKDGGILLWEKDVYHWTLKENEPC
jgi:hypothetical protein